LNTDNAELALQLSQQNYNGNFTVLVALEDEIKAPTLSFKNDSINYERQKKLWEQQIGSKVQLENKQLAYELSKNNLQLLKSKYESTKNELLTQVQQAQNTYKVSQIATKDFTVTSKINGRVYAVYKNPGEIVNTLEPLAAIGSANNFIIEMLVD
jgi:multidrug resistance efflux pump